MIRVVFGKSNGHFRNVSITGHAQYADPGEDLVCAAVSSIAFGMLNALDEMVGGADCAAENNEIKAFINQPDDRSDIIMKTVLIQLKTIEDSYNEFVEIKTLEV